MDYKEAIETYVNGNISDFKKWLKRCTKMELLWAVDYYTENHGDRQYIIDRIKVYLS